MSKGTHKWFVRFVQADGTIGGTVRRTKLKHEAISEVQRALPDAKVFEAYRVSENGARL